MSTRLAILFVLAIGPAVFGDQPGDGVVFRTVVRKQGDDGVHTYRIPGLATTPRGTLIAVFDARNKGSGDLPGDIDVAAMRSTDDGRTWSPMQRVLDFDAHVPNSRGNGVGDPCVLVDAQTGHVFVAGLWSKGNRAWRGSGPGTKPEETGQLVLTESADDGVSWSKPISLTPQVKKPEWRLLFQGPGSGVQTRDGTLVMPAQFKDAQGPHSCFLFSRDHGQSWKVSLPAIAGSPPTSESQVAELADGALLLSMRNEAKAGLRAWARWTWSGTRESGAWSPPWYVVTDPTCMASLLRHPHGELLFSSPNDPRKRVKLTIRASADGGRTWTAGRLLDPRPCSYSCMTVLKDGRVGVLYETGDAGANETLTFASFPLQWALAADAATPPAAPSLNETSPPATAVALAPVFGDHMVLQRDLPLPVWGKAAAGQSVTVEFAGQRKVTAADDHGDWRVTLDPLPASAEPRTLHVASAGATRDVADVLVGEVWVCAGQSNMAFALAREQYAADELPKAARGTLRLLNWTFAEQHARGKAFNRATAERLTPEKFYAGAWQASSPESAAAFSAVGYYFGKNVQEKLGVPVGLIHLAIGGSPTEAWIRREALAASAELRPMLSGNWLDNGALGPWCRQRGRENLAGLIGVAGGVPGDSLGPNHAFKPCFLWEAGVARLLPLAIRGVIWYQGESNAQEDWRVRQHEVLFPLLVRDWRQQWRQGDFPFYFCQLSGIEATGYASQFWPEFRDSQRRMAGALANVGMAVTSDLGSAHDVHPRNKREVGRRLALVALAKTYGAAVEDSGPALDAARPGDGQMRLDFDHADAGLRTSDGQPLRGFEIADARGAFHAAESRIEGSSVVLSAAGVKQPVRVRYAWQPFPTANLVNAAGLPTSTFQTSTTASR